MSDELDWEFSLRSPDLQKLRRIEKDLSKNFDVHLQEEVESIDVDGSVSIGDPLLRVIRRAAMTQSEVKEISTQFASLAAQEGLVYEGVSCCDPVDFDELFGWLSLDDAVWRLRHFTDSGLADDADVPWTFLVLTDTVDLAHRIADKLRDLGYDDVDVYDEPDEDGKFGLCVFVAGRNNEVALSEAYQKIEGTANEGHGDLHGMQFFTREGLEELCDEDDDDEQSD
jgi:hypothetical protein